MGIGIWWWHRDIVVASGLIGTVIGIPHIFLIPTRDCDVKVDIKKSVWDSKISIQPLGTLIPLNLKNKLH